MAEFNCVKITQGDLFVIELSVKIIPESSFQCVYEYSLVFFESSL